MTEKKVTLATLPSESNRMPEENLGLEYLVAESRVEGHEVEYIDSWMRGFTLEEIREKIMSYNPDILGISPSLDSTRNTLALVQSLRQSGFRGQIIAGGIYASFGAVSLILTSKGALTGVLTGEADATFQEYLDIGNVEGIKGAVYQRKNEVVSEQRQKVENDLDSLPFPNREHLRYVIEANTPSHVMGSRGCYGNCSFCSVTCFQIFSTEKRWRGRNPQSIVRELVQLYGKGETMVKFVDDNFFGGNDKSRELEIARLIQQSGIAMRFRLSLRVNDVSQEVISQLKRAGLFAVSLGAESFVPRKLKDFTKGITTEQTLRALKTLEDYKIYVQMGHIMFDPFVTLTEIELELHYLNQLTWPITKGICTQLYAAEGTNFTERIRQELGFVGKDGTNNIYKIQDPQARSFYEGLRIWARNNSRLYDMAIDPISAPKKIPSEGYSEFHELCVKLKSLDIEVADKILSVAKICPENCVTQAQREINDNSPLVQDIQRETDLLYEKYHLPYSAGINHHIY